MNFTELLTEVFLLTKRPDLMDQTSSQVKAATLKLHQKEFYAKDLVETGVQFDTAEFFQSFSYKDIFPLWRNIKYFRKFDIVSGTAGPELDIITPDGAFDSYSVEKSNVMYQAGVVYNIKMNTQERYFLIGYYSNPNLATDNFISWIAADHPWAIIYEAARVIFKTTGRDEDAAAMTDLIREQAAIMDIANIPTKGE